MSNLRPEFYTVSNTHDDRVNGYLLMTWPLGQALPGATLEMNLLCSKLEESARSFLSRWRRPPHNPSDLKWACSHHFLREGTPRPTETPTLRIMAS
jgi:hypothetical protein